MADMYVIGHIVNNDNAINNPVLTSPESRRFRDTGCGAPQATTFRWMAGGLCATAVAVSGQICCIVM